MQKNIFVLQCITYYFVIIKNMNATMSLRLDKNLKEEFFNYAKSLWVEPSMLLRRFMNSCLNRSDAVKIDIDEAIFDEVITSKKSKEKLKILWNKIKQLWF